MRTRTLDVLGLALIAAALTTVAASSGEPVTYNAITDRLVRPKPATLAPAAAGSRFTDTVFGSRLLRVTAANTRPNALAVSYRSPSGSHQNAWNTTGEYFYVISTDGSVVPFAFNRTTMTVSRINPSSVGDGGLLLRSAVEPEFSFVDRSIVFGVYNGAGSNLRTITAYDFSQNVYTPILNLDTVVSGLAGTYVGGLAASAGAVEKLCAFFGGASQGLHHYAIVLERRNPGARHVLNTMASTLNGVPTNIPLNFRLHHAFMDKSGQYVMLYPPAMDQQPPRSAAPAYLWTLATNTFTALPLLAARISGHDGIGYGYTTNQDCCTTTTWDAAQWQIRTLAAPFTTTDLINPVLSPKEIALADHQSWTNAEPSRLVPFISANYRVGINTTPWRAWDEEIIAVQTDRAFTGQGATVWRFAHHRSNVANDDNPAVLSFWYTPRAIVSQDGRWALFTSNWDKTLGIDSGGQAGGRYRQDAFIVELKMFGAPLNAPTGIKFDK